MTGPYTSLRMERLHAQAEGGNKLADLEAKRSAIVEEANERYRELQKTIDDSATTEAQKKELRHAQYDVRSAELFGLKNTSLKVERSSGLCCH